MAVKMLSPFSGRKRNRAAEARPGVGEVLWGVCAGRLVAGDGRAVGMMPAAIK